MPADEDVVSQSDEKTGRMFGVRREQQQEGETEPFPPTFAPAGMSSSSNILRTGARRTAPKNFFLLHPLSPFFMNTVSWRAQRHARQ